MLFHAPAALHTPETADRAWLEIGAAGASDLWRDHIAHIHALVGFRCSPVFMLVPPASNRNGAGQMQLLLEYELQPPAHAQFDATVCYLCYLHAMHTSS